MAFDGGSTMIHGRPIFSNRSRIFNSSPALTLAMAPQHRIGLGRPSSPIDFAFGARTSVGETIRATSPSISTASSTRTSPLRSASEPSSATTALRSLMSITRTGSPSAIVRTVYPGRPSVSTRTSSDFRFATNQSPSIPSVGTGLSGSVPGNRSVGRATAPPGSSGHSSRSLASARRASCVAFQRSSIIAATVACSWSAGTSSASAGRRRDGFTQRTACSGGATVAQSFPSA